MNSGRAVASTLRLTAGRSYEVLTARQVAASGNLMRVISTDVQSALPVAVITALCSQQLLAQHLIRLFMRQVHLETILKFSFYLTENTHRLYFRDHLFFKCHFTANSSFDKLNATHFFVSILLYVSLSFFYDHSFSFYVQLAYLFHL
jgi:hypothetical protein